MRGFPGGTSCSARIERTAHPAPTALQHVRVDHGRSDVLVPQEFLHRANIVTILQQVRGKTVSERMAAAALIQAGLAYRLLDRFLQHCFGNMMSTFSP